MEDGIYFVREGTGPDVVLIHGVGSWSDDWLGVVGHLAGEFTTLRYDLRGHGRSFVPPGPYRLDDFTDDLRRLMDTQGIERACVAGFSLGGLIAQSLAINHPDRVERLALLSSVAGRNAVERERVLARLAFIQDSPPKDYFTASVGRWFTEEFAAANPEAVRTKQRVVGSMDTDAYVAAYRVLAESDLADDLHRIQAETLVMTGENDIGSNPRMSELMAERIPDATCRILPHLKHSILLEAPDIVGPALRDFFAG